MAHKFVKGDTVVTINNWEDPKSVSEFFYVKEDKDYIWGNDGEPHHKGFCYPLSSKAELMKIVQHRADLKKALDDSMAMVYQFANAVSRGEYK